jgi:hypothetical protein
MWGLLEGPFSRIWTENDWDKPGYRDGKMTSLKLFSFERPHMRAFVSVSVFSCLDIFFFMFVQQHLSWISFFACFILWSSVPPLMPTIRKPACLSLDHPVCVHCFALFPDNDVMAVDETCRLCAPYNEDPKGGCGGIGPNYVEVWAANGSLSMKAAGFDARKIGMTADEISIGNTVGVLGTIIIRLVIGPISDQIGVRLSYSSLLLISCIPGFLICGGHTYISVHRTCCRKRHVYSVHSIL